MTTRDFLNDDFKFVIVDDSFFENSTKKVEIEKSPNIEIRIKKSYLNNIMFSSDISDSSVVMTEREKEVLKYLSFGLNNNEISNKMHVSIHTVKAHIHNILEKLCVQGRTEAVVAAIKKRLIKL